MTWSCLAPPPVVAERLHRPWCRRYLGRVVLLATILGAGCTVPAPTGYDVTGQKAHAYDLLYVAVIEITGRCPDFGAKLHLMLQHGVIGWGDPAPFTFGTSELGSEADPGEITMDPNHYLDLSYLERLIGDLYHEAGHSLGGLNDIPGSEYIDQYNRQVNSNAWDAYYNNSSCPPISSPPQ